MHRIPGRVLLITAAFALFLVPVAAIAAGGFDDVSDSNVFKADIQWMKDAGVTKGCNPPANTKFCPSDNVTREQMSAFMHRLAINKVVDAKTAMDADMLDGKDSSAFLEKGTFVTTIGGNAWEPWGAVTSSPSFTERHTSYTTFSGDGRVVIPLVSPAHIGGADLGLESVQICFGVDSGAPRIDSVVAWRSDNDGTSTELLNDPTDRTAAGCYSYTVNRATDSGIGLSVILADGGRIRLEGVKATWATGSFPAGGASDGSSVD